MSHRPEQIASVLRRAVQEQLARGLHDPRIRGLVSIVRVAVDDECSEATFHISVLPPEHAALTLEGLRSASVHIQRKAREGLPLRRMPRLRFVLDESLKRTAETEAAIARSSAAPSASGDGGGVQAEEGAGGPQSVPRIPGPC